MKNYFNSNERTKHIILLGMQTIAEEFAESNAITPEERKALLKVNEWLKKFNHSVCDRLGDVYMRKIRNTMSVNSLGLYGKYSAQKDCISNCAAEDVSKMADELQSLKCWECTRTNHKDCGVYACLVAVDKDGNDKEDGCPFRV